MSDLREAVERLIMSFPNSFINYNREFIADRKTNSYFILRDCKTPLDIKCKVLEWLSRAAYKGQPYSSEWRNRKFRTFMQDGINYFLGTNFSEEEFEIIYIYLGNAIKHNLTVKFIESDYDFAVIEEFIESRAGGENDNTRYFRRRLGCR